jgi:hypothetical protein
MADKDKMKIQQGLVKKLRETPDGYQNAAIYTILLDLVQGNGLDEVQEVLLDVANDLDKGIRIEFYNKPKKR